MLLFALPEARHLADPLARALAIALAPLEDRAFEDGEGKLRPLTSVRGHDVFVIQSLHSRADLSVNDRLCRLLFLMGVLRDHGAARITVVTPYLCYSRKDRRTKPRDPLTLRYVAQLIEALGCDRIVTLEVHNLMAFQNAFRCQTIHLDMATVFEKAVATTLADKPVCVLSPDPGGIKRAQLFREALEARLDRPVGFAFVDKRRTAGVQTGGALSGDVAGARVLIVDDIIASGGTILAAARTCHAHQAADCIAIAAHGLFTSGADALFQSGEVSRILVSDSVPAQQAQIEVVSAVPALATTIRRLANRSGQ
ncbi:ribose-phosphate pyrophosphokinase [Jannaschia faecimaris]|uniref:ribose-phosphate diphosphokinase n=1 Tax=Jannaschia faecimaris TaxID=1244108 RepID=A0A1H3S908_9RHOB|nr:ribose-phosphate diphosphokinase [Jannaschia faecimaris]SDZ34384.1 ribose-phosphate pyrophosphokinase [Jannaschia faecimaris]